MELLVTLNKMSLLEKLTKTSVDGIIFGSAFSSKFSYSLTELKQINVICKAHNLKRYISIDALIKESDKSALNYYFEFLKEYNPDGIYFADLGIIKVAQDFGLQDKLIYDPHTLLTNSLDALFWANRLNGAVIARELSFEEVEKILKRGNGKLDMQIFGHLRMSSSKRKFLSNYLGQIGKDIDILDDNKISLKEESRDYKLPIRETKYGTEVYTDYCLLMYKELISLRGYINRGIIDSDFLENDVVIEVVKELCKLEETNYEFLIKNITKFHPEVTFDTGYLYQKTLTKKEEND